MNNFAITERIVQRTRLEVDHVIRGRHCPTWYNPKALNRDDLDAIIKDVICSDFLQRRVNYKLVVPEHEFNSEGYLGTELCRQLPRPDRPIKDIPLIFMWCNTTWHRVRTVIEGLAGYDEVVVISVIDRTHNFPVKLRHLVDYRWMVKADSPSYPAKKCPVCLERRQSAENVDISIPPRLQQRNLNRRDFHFPPLSPSPP